MTRIVLASVLLFLVSRTHTAAATKDESRGSAEKFAGPFPSWRDLRRDYGAIGDARADDTDTLQRALDALTKHTDHCVLYVPAGTYRVTRTIVTARRAHTDMQSVALVGEDPARTILRYTPKCWR